MRDAWPRQPSLHVGLATVQRNHPLRQGGGGSQTAPGGLAEARYVIRGTLGGAVRRSSGLDLVPSYHFVYFRCGT